MCRCKRHRLNASLVDGAAAPHEMWSFFGSSLKWGKDDVLPIPAKFDQQNPFGAPVDTKDDLGRVGGGIPVVAFWTRIMGEAIGHIETLPLVISIPVSTTKDGRVAAAVNFPANTVLKPGESLLDSAHVCGGLQRGLLRATEHVVERGRTGRSGAPDKQRRELRGELVRLGLRVRRNARANDCDDTEVERAWVFTGQRSTIAGSIITATGSRARIISQANSIQKMVSDFHAQNIKVQLWWLPLAVEDGKFGYGGHKYVVSDVVKATS